MIKLFLGFFIVISFWSCEVFRSQQSAVGQEEQVPILNSGITEESGMQPVNQVNVFLGTSGDHGQLSPAASSPFNMLSIGPLTHPHTHTGYEHYAKEFRGFTHSRIEGVGCLGSGGNILIKPILDGKADTFLEKKGEVASPGYYSVNFDNGIIAEMAVKHNYGIHEYNFPSSEGGVFLDLSFALVDRFVAEEHEIENNLISGWVDTKTTCDAGVYRIYYALKFDSMKNIKKLGLHSYLITSKAQKMQINVGFSSVSENYAKRRLDNLTLERVKMDTRQDWNSLFSRISVKGEADREALFYSLLYRSLQAPFLTSERDGTYRAIDGTLQNSNFSVYNGWAIWDNYREQLPLLSLYYPDKFGDIAKSIANLYRFGKKNWATRHEPSPTVRTEHSVVVLLDAFKKGYEIDFLSVKDSLEKEASTLDYSAPDKALESSYDNWALAELFSSMGDTISAKRYYRKAAEYKEYWKKDFDDLNRADVDIMQARGLYQGTIWQYRWFVPFDLEGLKELAGGEDTFLKQLDQFFGDYNYNHANQPDLQVPGLYNATKHPWKSQKLFKELLLDPVVQQYFNNNSKGVDPYIGKIYQNQPKGYLRTMDDDAGTLSSWFVLRSIGLTPANIGEPVYYLTAPIFQQVHITTPNGGLLEIEVENYNKEHYYVQSVTLDGENLERNWLTQEEIWNSKKLVVKTGAVPNKEWGVSNQWISDL